MNITYRQVAPVDFEAIIKLGNQVHGEGYLDSDSIESIYQKSLKDKTNCSWVAYLEDRLVGFRLTYAPGNWPIDQYISSDLYPVSVEKVAYFKCNTVDASIRGQGIGKSLLQHSIESCKTLGAKAGVAHIWMQSPNNSAYEYFSRSGGKLIKVHPRKWQEDCDAGYVCTICGSECYCDAAEMMIQFDS